METQRILSVSELTGQVRRHLETHFSFVSVVGEISNLRKPASGHYYFTLKDKNAQLKTVLFKLQQRYLRELPVNGMEVICRGRISVYEPRGDYQFIIDTLEPRGTGELQLAFEHLKRKLSEEGLFSQETKKKLPFLPGHITLVTSPQGAAVHDFIKVSLQRCRTIPLTVYPVAVQGPGAADEIISAIKHINRNSLTDIIVLCRGGGSIEDLWTFNEEKMARAVFDSHIPIVSAIGHEIDHTIVDFVSDLRAPTPSAAAELIVPDSKILRKQVADLKRRMSHILTDRIQGYDDKISMQKRMLGDMQHLFSHFLLRLDHAITSLDTGMRAQIQRRQLIVDRCGNEIKNLNPLANLNLHNQRLEHLQYRLNQAVKTLYIRKETLFKRTLTFLDAVSPISTLARGYSIVQKGVPQREIITDATRVGIGEEVKVILYKGSLECEVKTVMKGELEENSA